MPEQWIVVRNWDRFQHRDAARTTVPSWIKLYTELLSDPAFYELTLRRRGILVGLWLEYGRSRRRLTVESRSLSHLLRGRVTVADLKALNRAGFIEFSASKPASNYASEPAGVEKRREEDPLPRAQSAQGIAPSVLAKAAEPTLACAVCGEPIKPGARCVACGASPRQAGSNPRAVRKPKRSAYERAEAMTRNGGWHYALDDYRNELADYNLTDEERDMLEHLWAKLSTEPADNGDTPGTVTSEEQWRELF